jgi:hypothetical protein
MYTYQNRGQLSYGEAVFYMYTLLDINISIFAFLNGCAWDFINISIFAFLCSSRSPRAMIAAENCVILECPRDNGLNDLAKQASIREPGHVSGATLICLEETKILNEMVSHRPNGQIQQRTNSSRVCLVPRKGVKKVL